MQQMETSDAVFEMRNEAMIREIPDRHWKLGSKHVTCQDGVIETHICIWHHIISAALPATIHARAAIFHIDIIWFPS